MKNTTTEKTARSSRIQKRITPLQRSPENMTVTISLPKDLVARLDEVAGQIDSNRSQILRRLLSAAVDPQVGKLKSASFLQPVIIRQKRDNGA